MLKSISILIGFLLISNVLLAQSLKIPFAESKPIIDGNIEEWNFNIDLSDNNQVLRYRNHNLAALSWDLEYLYIAYNIKDKFLCENERGNDNPRLYFNDAVEVYIDSHNDSKDKMDLNDYQFIVTLRGETIIFKGDKEQIKEGNLVPKEFGTANIIFKAKTNVSGTINNLLDEDIGYSIEMALPWDAIGVNPKAGQIFKMDICVDDIDTIANIRTWPNDAKPKSLNFINLKKKSDFGFPNDWQLIQLDNGPSSSYQVRQILKENTLTIIIVAVLILLFLSAISFIQYRKIQFLKNLPTRRELLNTQVEEKSPLLSHQVLIDSKNNKVIQLARDFIFKHIESDFAIDTLAQHLNISTRQLQRIFKEEANLTPKQFITIIRLEKASELLKGTDSNVSETAFACGFSDPGYFNQVFKRYFGVSPSNFKA